MQACNSVLVNLYRNLKKNCSTWAYPRLNFFYILYNRTKQTALIRNFLYQEEQEQWQVYH